MAILNSVINSFGRPVGPTMGGVHMPGMSPPPMYAAPMPQAPPMNPPPQGGPNGQPDGNPMKQGLQPVDPNDIIQKVFGPHHGMGPGAPPPAPGAGGMPSAPGAPAGQGVMQGIMSAFNGGAGGGMDLSKLASMLPMLGLG